MASDPSAAVFPVLRLSRRAGELRTQLDLLRAGRELERLTRDLAPDCLLVGNFRPFGYFARALHRSLGLPYLLFFHGLDLMRLTERGASSRWRRWGYERIGRDAAGFLTSSGFAASLIRREFPRWAESKPITAIRPGVDLQRFRPGPEPARPVLLTVARYAPRKGIDFVLRVMPRLLESVPDLVYRVVGHGDRAPYQALADSLGLGSSVELRGPASDDELPGLYRDCTAFVMLTTVLEGGIDVEGFGMVYLEAGASGRPVVAAAVGGVAEAVADGESGLLIPPDDPEAAARALHSLLADRALRRQLGDQGRRRVEAEFAWPKQAAALRAAARAACLPVGCRP